MIDYKKVDGSFSLAGKTCLVTGAANGIGKASATLYASKGANVALVDLQESVHDVAPVSYTHLGPLNHLSILVDDVERAKAELESKGVKFETELLLDADLYPRGEKFAIFRGQDNERLQLEQIL